MIVFGTQLPNTPRYMRKVAGGRTPGSKKKLMLTSTALQFRERGLGPDIHLRRGHGGGSR